MVELLEQAVMVENSLKTEQYNRKMVSEDRVFVLKQIEGKSTLDSAGLTDTRLFTGENNLHAVKSTDNFWVLRYDNGGLPGALKQKFTSFPVLRRFVESYFKKRNIAVTDVLM